MARHATPKILEALHGKPGRRPISTSEPDGVGDIWAPPSWFDAAQRLQWDYAVAHSPPGLLTGTDREVLVIWTVACVEHAKAVLKVRELGQIVQTALGNAIQNPYMAIVNKQAFIMLRAGAEMGFSPAARSIIGRGAMEQPQGSGAPTLGQPRNSSRLAAYLDAKPDKLDS